MGEQEAPEETRSPRRSKKRRRRTTATNKGRRTRRSRQEKARKDPTTEKEKEKERRNKGRRALENMEEKPEGWEGHPFHLLGHAGRLVRGLVGSRTFVGLIQSCAHRSGKDLFPLLRSWQHSWVRPTSLDLCTEVGLARSPLEKEVLARLSRDAVSFVEGDGLSNEVRRRPEVPWSRRWCDLSISYGGEVVERDLMQLIFVMSGLPPTLMMPS